MDDPDASTRVRVSTLVDKLQFAQLEALAARTGAPVSVVLRQLAMAAIERLDNPLDPEHKKPQ